MIVFIVYYLICLVYLFFALFKRERLVKSIIMILIPFFGLIFVVISSFNFKKDNPYLFEFSKGVSDINYIKKSDINEDKNTISVMEALVLNDDKTRREILLKIFKGSPMRYVKELKVALNDKDTETSHYASAALTEIKRKCENEIINLGIKYRNSNDINDKINYLNSLKSYIELDITDHFNKKRYITEYCSLAVDELLEMNNKVDVNIFKSLILYNLEIKLYDTYKMVNVLVNLYPMNEESYFTALEVYYNLSDRENFMNTIESIKQSNIKLSKEKLLTLRYFLGR